MYNDASHWSENEVAWCNEPEQECVPRYREAESIVAPACGEHAQETLLPGRKTDMTDAEWLAQLMQFGLLKRSFIPPRPQRELRELVRYRQTLVEERTRVVNRLQKVLEDANIKLASVVTDVQGVSAQAMLAALVRGVTDAAQLADLARGRLRNKLEELEQALTGRVRGHHRFLLAELLCHLDFVDERIAHLEAEIERRLADMPDFVEAVERLDTIPGVDRLTAIAIVAEIGVDMSRFPSDRHLSSWAGMAPGNNASGGKQRSGKTRKGNGYRRRTLVQAARAAARTKGTYLKAQYHRIAARRGKNRAAVAVGHTILQIAYYLILRHDVYRDLGADHFDRLDAERTTQRLVRRLEGLGYRVSLQALGDDVSDELVPSAINTEYPPTTHDLRIYTEPEPVAVHG